MSKPTGQTDRYWCRRCHGERFRPVYASDFSEEGSYATGEYVCEQCGYKVPNDVVERRYNLVTGKR